MADESPLQHLERLASSLRSTKSRSSIISRGRKDSSEIGLKSGIILRATFRTGKKSMSVTEGRLVTSPRPYGIIGGDGEVIVEAVHNAIEPFSCGLALFATSPIESRVHGRFMDDVFEAGLGSWGYLDVAGLAVIPQQFERARSFSENLAAIAIGGKWGFINRVGSITVPLQYEAAHDFRDGLAIVRRKSKYGFVDASGAFVIDPRFECLCPFSEGLAYAETSRESGYVDLSGAFVISLETTSSLPSDFNCGVARVSIGGVEQLINRHGRIIFRCKSEDESISKFRDGVALVHETGGYHDHAYYIDADGHPIFQNEEDSEHPFAGALDGVSDFSEGLGLVAASVVGFDWGRHPIYRYADRKGTERLFGYVDRQGLLRIQPRFYDAKPFSQGLAVVDPTGSGTYGLADLSGSLVLEPQFSVARSFASGLAAVKKTQSDRWGFIDQSGQQVIHCQFSEVSDFQSVKKVSFA